MSNNPVHLGYTKEELALAFDAVVERTDWRGQITAFVDAEVADLTKAAVEFFTGTQCHIDRRGPFLRAGRVYIHST